MKTFVIADLHFNHKGVCHFTRNDGTPLRPWDDVNEMNEALVANWNATVGVDDKVYVLGDCAMSKSGLHYFGRCNGKKVLIKGNHDQEKLSAYTPYFDDIRAYKVMKGLILSHIPIHPGSLSRWQFNVHGHTHANKVLDEKGNPDKRYICVSVEQTDYRPYDLQKIINLLEF